MATPDLTQGLLNDVKKNKFSLAGTSLSEDDMFRIWENVANFVERQMQSGKGVHIPNFGNFSFTQQKLDVGNNKFVLIQRPVFQALEKFCQTHQLKQTKYPVAGCIPVVQLNYTVLSLETPFHRDQVESCVREMSTSLNRAVAQQRNVEFTFVGLGRMQIREGKVKFKFYKEFVNSIDSSGKIVHAMQNRPETADSVMSNRAPSRAFSVALPKLNVTTNGNGMPVIAEDEVLTDCQHDDEGHNETEQQERKLASSLSTGRPGGAPIASGFDLNEMLAVTASAADAGIGRPPTEHGLYREELTSPATDPGFGPMTPPRALSAPQPPPEYTGETGRSSMSDDGSHASSPKPMLMQPRPPSTASTTSSCGHAGAGQELCYLCHQRQRRNIPVSFSEELRRREDEEDRALAAYAQMKDTENVMKEHESLLAKRHDSQKISAFNIGVADATKQRKLARDPNFYPSYVFQHRPLTPPKIYKQLELNGELQKQVDEKESTKNRARADENFLERLEQVQLAEDLAAQRDAYIRERAQQQNMYRTALSAQVRYKPVPLPAKEPNSKEPVFGKNDVTIEKILDQRRRAQEVSRDQLDTVSNRKREDILRRLQEQKYEEERLKRAKEELVQDRARRYQHSVKNRRSLEEDWAQMALQKRERDVMDKVRRTVPAGLLHEQCDQYKRCNQCKKKLVNKGESNIWCDSYYIPGSRYMC